MRSFKDDYKYGIQQEDRLLKTLSNFFDDDLKKLGNYNKYDFKGDNKYYEMKSRKNTKLKYPTTLIPFDKVLTPIKGKDIYFIFNFTDKLTYIKYDKEQFKNYELKPFKRFKRKDFNDKEKLYYFIPVQDLIDIN